MNPFPHGDPLCDWRMAHFLSSPSVEGEDPQQWTGARHDDRAGNRLARPPAPAGMTLIELVVVVGILAVLAGVIVPQLTGFSANGRDTAARTTLAQVREAIVGTVDKPGYFSDIGHYPNSIADLLRNPFATTDPLYAFNRDTGLGWRGPYVSSSISGFYPATDAFGVAGDPAIVDPWGHAVIIQRFAPSGGNLYFFDRSGNPTGPAYALDNKEHSRVISLGPDGNLSTAYTDLSAASTGNDIVIFLSSNH